MTFHSAEEMTSTNLVSDIIEYVCHVAQMSSREDGIQHLALLFVLSTIRCEQARSQREAYTAAIKWTVTLNPLHEG